MADRRLRRETIISWARAPLARNTDWTRSFRSSHVSGSPSTASPSPDGVARRSSSRAVATPASAASALGGSPRARGRSCGGGGRRRDPGRRRAGRHPPAVRPRSRRGSRGDRRRPIPRPRAMRRASSSSYSWVGGRSVSPRPIRTPPSAARPARDRGPRPHRLHRVDDDRASPVHLRVENVGDPERHLVAELRCAACRRRSGHPSSGADPTLVPLAGTRCRISQPGRR